MLSVIENLIKVLQALIELFKEAKKAPLVMIIILSMLLNAALVYLWYSSEHNRKLDKDQFLHESQKKDSIFNAYLININDQFIKQATKENPPVLNKQ